MRQFNEILLKILIFSFLSGLFSCGKDTVGSTNPYIATVSPSNTFVGDIITIEGKNFGFNPSDGKIIFPNNVVIQSKDCQKWTDVIIRLTVPKGAGTGDISIVTGNITSNTFKLTVDVIPPVEMIDVNPGQFLMGSATGLSDEQPAHIITISQGFSISKYEITQQIWEAAGVSNPSINKNESWPVNNLNWLDAVKFCNTLSQIKGLNACYQINGTNVIWDTLASGFRLPTEAEWEYACRAGSPNSFSGTGTIEEMGWFGFNSGFKPHPTGDKQPNSLGIYDMHGNASEWCWDFYNADYYKTSVNSNPKGPASGSRRVIRGGSWADGQSFCRSSNRSVPDSTNERCGLRVVKNK